MALYDAWACVSVNSILYKYKIPRDMGGLKLNFLSCGIWMLLVSYLK
jgi:hypothetical protein